MSLAIVLTSLHWAQKVAGSSPAVDNGPGTQERADSTFKTLSTIVVIVSMLSQSM